MFCYTVQTMVFDYRVRWKHMKEVITLTMMNKTSARVPLVPKGETLAAIRALLSVMMRWQEEYLPSILTGETIINLTTIVYHI